ncbi:MAG: hypothetical protein J7539_14825 [Niabella sp.]|nr:hypothetical protein [Niabella sp.]
MNKKPISKKNILKAVAKIATDKEMVRSYVKGKTSLKTLAQKGIKFAKPV